MNPTTPERPWLPISEAKRDDTWYELQLENGRIVRGQCAYHRRALTSDSRDWLSQSGGFLASKPTHFRPLPSTETGERECEHEWKTVASDEAVCRKCGISSKGPPTPPHPPEAAKAALHKIRSCCGSVHDERNLVDRLAIEALAAIDALPDAEQLRAENEELKSRLKEQGATLLAFVESPAGDLKITREKLETANRVCAELEDEVKQLNQECTDYVDCISRHTRVGEALTAERDALRKEVEAMAKVEWEAKLANMTLALNLAAAKNQRDEARAAHDAEVKRADELAEQLGVARVALAEATSGHLIAELHRQIDSHKATINSLSAALTAAQQAAREDGQ